MNPIILRVEDLSFAFEEQGPLVLRNVAFDIPAGQFVAVVGRNGSGKSTLAKMLNGLLTPTSGSVTVGGHSTAASQQELDAVRETVGMVFQNPDNQLVASVVEEDVAFGPENLGVPPAQIRERVEAALQKVGMAGFASRGVATLSGGQKQRVAIAGALAVAPRVLVLDEPTAMLDPNGRAEVMQAVAALQRDGMTVVLITHFMEEVVRADRVIALCEGKIAFDGTPAAFFAEPQKVSDLGLVLPRMVQLSDALRGRGVPLPAGIMTLEDMQTALCDLPLQNQAAQAPAPRPAEGEPLVCMEGVSFSYNAKTSLEQVALEDINFTLPRGAFVGLIGHTGSGKSTLIQHINALLQPTAGRVVVAGVDLAQKHNRKQARALVGLVFQYPEAQLFEETVEKDIAFGPRNMGLGDEEIKQRCAEALATVGLADDYRERSPFALSGGQKRRVAIAGVLAMRPQVLVLDEPAAGLDPASRDAMLNLIQQLHEEGITVVLVSHAMEDISAYCPRVLVLSGGKLHMDGAPREVFARGDDLRALGLQVPDIYALREALAQKGIDLPPADDIQSFAAAVANLCRGCAPCN